MMIFIRMIVKTNKIKVLQACSQIRLLIRQMQMIILDKIVNISWMQFSQLNGQPERSRISLTRTIEIMDISRKKTRLLFSGIISYTHHFTKRKTLKKGIKSQSTIN